MTAKRWPAFIAGAILGGAATLAVSATGQGYAPPPHPLRPVTVTLHRFDVVPGEERQYNEWIAFLRANHREAVATLPRERTYFEAMFDSADEPRRLYWVTVQGAGGATVESSPLELDRRHNAYMAAILVKGSHHRFATRNVLAPDFITTAVRAEQRRE